MLEPQPNQINYTNIPMKYNPQSLRPQTAISFVICVGQHSRATTLGNSEVEAWGCPPRLCPAIRPRSGRGVKGNKWITKTTSCSLFSPSFCLVNDIHHATQLYITEYHIPDNTQYTRQPSWREKTSHTSELAQLPCPRMSWQPQQHLCRTMRVRACMYCIIFNYPSGVRE